MRGMALRGLGGQLAEHYGAGFSGTATIAHARATLADQLMVTATYQSWDFRWAYVLRYATDFHLSAEERSRLLRTSLDTSQREHEFYVALAVPTRRWGDLSSPSSGWRVPLQGSGRDASGMSRWPPPGPVGCPPVRSSR